MPIRVSGTGPATRKLTKLSKIKKGLTPTARNIAQHGVDVVSLYPRKPTGSRYVRTNKYGGSVDSTVRPSGSGVRVEIFSRGVAHAKWLKKPQARHMGHWNHLSLDAVQIGRYAISQVKDYVRRVTR